MPAGRTKPWGTGQALLACREVLKEPFAVINADDYYGKEAFGRLYAFLQRYDPQKPGAFVWPDSFCAIPSVSTGA